MNDEVHQKAEWRARLMADVLSNSHDEDTRAELLIAGLDQAHQEGLADAAEICQKVADARPDSRRVASVLALAIRALARRNKITDASIA